MPWTPNLAVGVPLIDDEHKELFSRVDALFEAGKNRKSAEYIGELLGFLDDYTKKHFSDEENYMLSIRYPGYAVQKEQHTLFIGHLEKLKDDYAKSGGSLLVILDANQFMLTWLTQHISVLDKQIGDYAKKLHN